MTNLDRLIAYWPAYRDSLSTAKNLGEAETLLRTHHNMGTMAFQDLMKRVRTLATDEKSAEPAFIVGN